MSRSAVGDWGLGVDEMRHPGHPGWTQLRAQSGIMEAVPASDAEHPHSLFPGLIGPFRARAERSAPIHAPD